jgi:iron complex transport system ATP-binding protein
MAAGFGPQALAMRLAARELAFGYRDKRVGEGVSLAAEAGEILCLLGPNGSGKTTLFKTLLGLLKPQAGDITLDGENIMRMPRRRLAQAMAYVPQAHTVYVPFTVLDTVLMGRAARVGLFSAPTVRDREVARGALELFRVSELQDNLHTLISGGQRQLVLIARAVAQQAKILIMDEPTASLDFGNQMLVLDHIKRLAREKGLGVIYSTHDPDQALTCADRVAMLHSGHLIRYGLPKDVITRESLALLYGVDVDVVPLDGLHYRVCVPRARD